MRLDHLLSRETPDKSAVPASGSEGSALAGPVRPRTLTAAYARHGDVPRHERMRTNDSIPKRKRKIREGGSHHDGVRSIAYDVCSAGGRDPLPPESQKMINGYCEDTKGARRMPWHRKSTKDAASCEKPRGGANGLRSGGVRTGEPGGGHAPPPAPELIRCGGQPGELKHLSTRRRRNQPRSRE